MIISLIKKSIPNVNQKYLILIMIISMFTLSDNRNTFLIFYFIGAIFILKNLFFKNKKIRIKINWIFKALTVMFIYYTLSLSWSISPQYDVYKFVLFNFFLLISVIQYATQKNRIEIFIYSFIVSGCVMCLHIFILSGFSFFLTSRIFVEGYNSNFVGMALSISSLSCLYFYFSKRNLKFLIPTPVFTLFIFNSGSKKAFFMFLFTVIVFLLLNAKNVKKKMIYIISSLFFIILVAYAILQIPYFYNIIGNRVEDLFRQVIYQEQGQDDIRFYMIEYGYQQFKLNPFWGYGIGNFANLFSKVSLFATYSHNNYIEILVNFGIVGFFLYYVIYFKIIKDSIIFIRKNSHLLISYFLTLMITLLLLEFGLVSYFSSLYQLIITLAFMSLRIVKDAKNEKII